MAQEETTTIDQLNEEADIAADYLAGLLDIADYEGDIEMGVRNGRPMVQIIADDDTDIKHLIGCNGEVVDALQQLTRLAVQQKTGERIEIAPDFSNVQRGDLVFFGRKATADRKEGISHVGIYLGNKRFIHALGDVHISSFDPEDERYDEFNTGRLLFATRFLPYINKEKGMNTTDHNLYYLYH